MAKDNGVIKAVEGRRQREQGIRMGIVESGQAPVSSRSRSELSKCRDLFAMTRTDFKFASCGKRA